MSDTIKRLSIEGFKSIRSLREFELSAINVLIGPNGAGKSNFVSFFRLLRELIDQRLQIALATTEGGADACLYLGPRVTKGFGAKLLFGNNGYEFTLVPTLNNQFAFADEITLFHGNFGENRSSLGSGHVEARLKTVKDEPGKHGARRGVGLRV